MPRWRPDGERVAVEDDELLEAYRVETQDQCSRAEEILLGVTDGTVTRPMMDELFRIAHTIKGSGMGVGIEVLPDFVHHWEDILTKTRELEFPVRLSDATISLFLRCNDAVLEFVSDASGEASRWVDRLAGLRNELTDVADAEVTALLEGEPVSAGARTSSPDELPTPAAAEPASHHDPSKAAPLAAPLVASMAAPAPAITTEDDDALVRAMQRAQQIAAASAAAAGTATSSASGRTDAAPAKPEPALDQTAKTNERSGESNETIRVKLARIDLLIQRIGELAVHQQLVAGRITDLSEDPELETDSRKLGQLANEAHDVAMSLRMVPVQPMMRTLRRTCRDTALKLSKKVDFVTVGEDTELDLALVQTTSDALMHLVRNAVDHGIETTQERAATSKPATATVTLAVAQRGGNVEIDITDDGRGIDSERIRQKAIGLGWISESDQLSREQLFAFLFKPGFSTSAKITEFSGRGVGLDVVATSIAALDGSISVQSELGHGTSIKLTLPLSVAVVDVMRVQIEGQAFLVPLHTIQETVAVSRDSLRTAAAGASTVMVLRGRAIPIHLLRNVLRFDTSPPVLGAHRASAIVTNWRSAPLAFVVDDIEGRQQVVVKPLSPELGHIAGLSGCAILGDGRVGLILDLASLITSRRLAAAA